MNNEHWIEVRERDFVDFSKVIRFVMLTPSEFFKWKKRPDGGSHTAKILTDRGEATHTALALVCSGDTRFVFLTEKEAQALRDKLPRPK